jgi:hypothetical protein
MVRHRPAHRVLSSVSGVDGWRSLHVGPGCIERSARCQPVGVPTVVHVGMCFDHRTAPCVVERKVVDRNITLINRGPLIGGGTPDGRPRRRVTPCSTFSRQPSDSRASSSIRTSCRRAAYSPVTTRLPPGMRCGYLGGSVRNWWTKGLEVAAQGLASWVGPEGAAGDQRSPQRSPRFLRDASCPSQAHGVGPSAAGLLGWPSFGRGVAQ